MEMEGFSVMNESSSRLGNNERNHAFLVGFSSNERNPTLLGGKVNSQPAEIAPSFM